MVHTRSDRVTVVIFTDITPTLSKLYVHTYSVKMRLVFVFSCIKKKKKNSFLTFTNEFILTFN